MQSRAMRFVFASTLIILTVAQGTPAAAAGPESSATDTISLHQGLIVATTADGLYRWDGTEWKLWHPWSLRGVNRSLVEDQEDEEELEKLRAFDEVVEELVPSYGESAALRAATDLLGYDRPKPKLRFEGVQERTQPLHRAVLSAASHRGWFWACTVDGMVRVGATVRRLAHLGTACYDLVAGAGLLVAATERGFYRLIRPGEWVRISGPLPGLLLGLGARQGVAYAATSGGIFELGDRPIRRSGVIADAFGTLGDRLVVVRSGKVSFVDEQGQLRPTGKQVAGTVMRAGDGSFLVTTEEIWRSVGDSLRWVPIRPTDGELRGALDYGGLWLATSSGVVLPERLVEDQMVARLGAVLSPQRAVAFAEKTQQAMLLRGLDMPKQNPAWATWLPQLSFTFDNDDRRGVGIRDLEALADSLDVEPEDLDPDLVEAEREWRNDLLDGGWRAMVKLTWRPAPERVARYRVSLESARNATFRERRRVSKKAARMLAGYLAAERRLIVHPPRTVKSAVRRLLKVQTKRALVEGLLNQEIP